MSRKTIRIDQLRDYVNTTLKISTESPDMRQGRIQLLESILQLTGNYNGYCYLTQAEVPAGQLPGIRHENEAHAVEDKFYNTDKTRVRYF